MPEGGTVYLNGDLQYALEKNVTVTVDWGDNVQDTLHIPAGTTIFSHSHAYPVEAADPSSSANTPSP